MRQAVSVIYDDVKRTTHPLSATQVELLKSFFKRFAEAQDLTGNTHVTGMIADGHLRTLRQMQSISTRQLQ